MQRATAVLLQTHFFDHRMARMFRRLQRQSPPNFACFVLMHLPPDAKKPDSLRDVPHHFMTTPEIRDPAYTGKSAGGAEWNFWNDGHTDLVWLHFFRAHPEFERYWCIEYDVRFSGTWSNLFAAFEDNDADFLTTSLRTAETDSHWVYWSSLRAPPSDSAILPDADRLKGFLPLWRASRAGMQAMDEAYRAGWAGHAEVTWPTLIRKAGLTVEDLGGYGPFVRPENKGKFYSNTSLTWDYSPGSFVYKPAKHFVGLRRNRLYHPVKPLSVTLREDKKRVEAKLRLALQRLQTIFSPLRGRDQQA